MILSKELTVANKAGFHVRVASMICKTAMKYEAKISLAKGAYVADCKSCLDLLTLMAPCGERLTLVVDGEDAEDALSAIELLFERKFYEDEFADCERSE
jgi:phosphocarrier protein NPr